MARGLKTGGRKEGTPNKLTKDIREILVELVKKELTSLPKNLSLLEGKDRIDVLIKLMPFVMPKVATIQFDGEDPMINELKITIVESGFPIATREEDIIIDFDQ